MLLMLLTFFALGEHNLDKIEKADMATTLILVS